jgi:hypothetical protein
VYENRTIEPVEIILRSWGGEMRKNDREGESN